MALVRNPLHLHPEGGGLADDWARRGGRLQFRLGWRELVPAVGAVAEPSEDHRPALRAGLDRRLAVAVLGRIVGIDAVDGTMPLDVSREIQDQTVRN